MLVFVALLTAVGLYLAYRVHRTSQRIEGITAATFPRSPQGPRIS